ETNEEVVAVLRDLRAVDVDIITLGQYLRPSDAHIALDRYVTPEEFRWLRDVGMDMGFKHVESGPLVRSSYHAWEQVQAAGVLARKRSVPKRRSARKKRQPKTTAPKAANKPCRHPTTLAIRLRS